VATPVVCAQGIFALTGLDPRLTSEGKTLTGDNASFYQGDLVCLPGEGQRGCLV